MILQKDLFTRVTEIIGAWGNMRPNKSFFGLTLDGFKLKAKTYLDALDELAKLEEQWTHATSKRDQAARELTPTVLGVVLAVGGDPEETQNGELYGAMGYVPRNQRSSGLVRPSTAAKHAEGGKS